MKLLAQKSSSSSQGSGSMDFDMAYPTKPVATGLGEPIGLRSNFYKFDLDLGGRDVLFEYQVTTAPTLLCHTNEEKLKMRKIIRLLKPNLEAQFNNYVYWEGFLYSFEKIDELEAVAEMLIEEDEVQYTISIALFK